MGGYGTHWLWELVDRGPGWDGHDAVAITADVVENAIAFIGRCPVGPETITPLPSGGVALEWSKNDKRYIIVSVYEKEYKAVSVKISSMDRLLDDGDGVLEMIEEVIK